jgi:integrase
VQLKAMILLGVNCGFGNNDCATLPIAALDLDGGWIVFPRPKTGIERRCPLWPETAQAIRGVIEKRKAPHDSAHDELLFLTKYRRPWFTEGRPSSALSYEFRKLLQRIDSKTAKAAEESSEEAPAKIYGPGKSFYTLRHCFQTVSDELGDYIATKRIMGHADGSISDSYRERFPDERLRKVTDHVHTWLFGKGGA